MATQEQSFRVHGSGRMLVAENAGRGVAMLVAAATFLLSYADGTYALDGRSALAVAVWWAVLVAVAVGVRGGAWTTTALVSVGLLVALGGWTLASVAWASDAELAYSEFARVALYLGLFVLVVLLARRPLAGYWSDGLAIGILAVAVLALASRFYPNAIGSDAGVAYLPTLRSRLSYPIGYWNGLGILAGMGMPLLLGSALRARARLIRALFLAGMPALAGTIYLTSSRGAVATAMVGLLVFVALCRRRWAALGAMFLAGAASVAVVEVLSSRTSLANGLTGAITASEGRSAAAWLIVICVVTGLLYAVGLSVPGSRRVPNPVFGWIVVALAGLAVLVAALAAHPIRRIDQFKRPPSSLVTPQHDFVKTHLLSASGGGRWQFWEAAVAEFHHHPLLGGGAGSYAAWWAQHGTLATSIQNAHSLYLETLGELGVIGFTLLAVLVLVGLAAVVRAARANEDDDSWIVAAVGGAFCAFLLAAGIDWMWELTSVAVVAVVCLGITVVLGGVSVRWRATSRTNRLIWRVCGVVVAFALIMAEAIPLVAQLRIGASQRASRQGDTEAALSDARAAIRVEPWAATPYLQLALVYEQSGDLTSARAELERARARNPDGWQIALVSARVETELGDIAAARKSYARARDLNPRSALFAAAKG